MQGFGEKTGSAVKQAGRPVYSLRDQSPLQTVYKLNMFEVDIKGTYTSIEALSQFKNPLVLIEALAVAE